jgi:radical SAM protein with 4Fe4S-binding SPASM domain
LSKIVDNILIPIESGSEEKEGEITGVSNVLNRKIRAIEILKMAGIKIVRVGSVGTKKGIKDFDKMSEMLLRLPIDEWEWYRPISSGVSHNIITAYDMEMLANKILKLRKKTKIKLSIANAIPFCAHKNMKKMASVCVGALADDGHSRLVIDPRGFVKPHYFVEKNIGDPLDIMRAWNSLYMKKIRSLELLPATCQKCEYMMHCRGGSRHEAKIAYGKFDAKDPFMRKAI